MTVDLCNRVRVRYWAPGDSPALSKISNWAAVHTAAHFRCINETAKQWEARVDMISDRHACLVAELECRPVGYAAGQSYSGGCGFGGVAEVSVYIYHEFTGAGLGTQLYEHLIPLLSAQGYCRLLASITEPNAASERLHHRFGFTRAGILKRVGWKFGRWHDVAHWELDLVHDDSAPPTIRPAREVFEELRAGSVEKASTKFGEKT